MSDHEHDHAHDEHEARADRAPVILSPDTFDFWLDCKSVDEKTAAAALAPAPEGLMEVYEISTAVNRVANDSAKLIEPYSADTSEAAAPVAQATPKPSSRRKRDKDGGGQASLF